MSTGALEKSRDWENVGGGRSGRGLKCEGDWWYLLCAIVGGGGSVGGKSEDIHGVVVPARESE